MADLKRKYEIRFEGLSAAEAGSKAKALRQEIVGTSPDADVTLAKDDPTNMDFGSTLVLLLGTQAALAIAKGIASYLSRAHAKITIWEDGTLVASDLTGADAARIAEALSKGKK